MAVIDDILNLGNDVAGSVSGISRDINRTANKIKSLGGGFKTPSNIRDYSTNGFLPPLEGSSFVPEFFARAFDEPTYLSFRIEFITDPIDISNSERNISYNNIGWFSNNETSQSAIKTVQYSKMFDYMPEPFLDEYVVHKVSDSSLGKGYSTESYLDMNLGDHARAMLLHNFKLALKDIQTVFPFYFKNISGLSSLMKVNSKSGIRLKDAKITIECEEGLDLKITQLLNMYRKIVWDDTYQRWVLPDMMRYFGMRIYISEIRLFQDRLRQGELYKYDFTTAEGRNATHASQFKESKFEQGVQTATALSNAFLGTKSIITKALNTTANALNAINDVKSNLIDINKIAEYCNNAINTVMPTICLECHMCEFDIEDTMKYLDKLQSSNKGNNAVAPSISIKVGQVKETHSYPLNSTLVYTYKDENGNEFYPFNFNPDTTIKGYKKLFNYNEQANISSFYDLNEMKDKNLRFAGNTLSDEVLNKKYRTDKLDSRIDEFVDNLTHAVGETPAATINAKRFYPHERTIKGRGFAEGFGVVDTLYDGMMYSKETMTQSQAKMSLTTQMLNKSVDEARRVNIDSNIVGTDSLATNQESRLIETMNSIGDIMNDAVERIYNSSEIKSMATNDESKAQIANRLFSEYISNIDEQVQQNTVLKEYLRNLKTLIKYDDNYKSATERDSIEFGLLKNENEKNTLQKSLKNLNNTSLNQKENKISNEKIRKNTFSELN